MITEKKATSLKQTDQHRCILRFMKNQAQEGVVQILAGLLYKLRENSERLGLVVPRVRSNVDSYFFLFQRKCPMDDRPVAALPTVGRGRGRGVRGDSRSGKRGGSTATADTDAYRVPQEKADNIPGSDTNVRSPNTERKRGRGTSSVVGGSTRGRGRGKPSNNKPTESLSKDSEAEPSHDLSKEKASNLTGWGAYRSFMNIH